MFRQSVSRGSGPSLAAALRTAAATFDAGQTEDILRYSIEHANPSAASLAMAELAPGMLEQPAVATLLFDKLDHRDLGVTAALILGASKLPYIQEDLAELASGEPGITSRRATLAINTRGPGAQE